MSEPPALKVAVLIERQKDASVWEDWRFRVCEVVLDEGGYGTQPRLLRDDGKLAQTLHPGLAVSLHPDEAEGYYLNLTSGMPSWFVWWRVDDADPSRAWPERVTLSYYEAGRLLDAEERVDSLPVPQTVRDWLQAYADANYRPEPKRRVRPASFRAPEQR
jgi:hypothetical protein